MTLSEFEKLLSSINLNSLTDNELCKFRALLAIKKEEADFLVRYRKNVKLSKTSKYRRAK